MSLNMSTVIPVKGHNKAIKVEDYKDLPIHFVFRFW